MKRCPKCNLSYSDDSLEFCLEDGSRLITFNPTETETKVISKPVNLNPTNAETVNLPFSTPLGKLGDANTAEIKTFQQSKLLKERAIEQGHKILETAPLVIALAHNWWQWIYLNNQSYSSFASYFFSTNFLTWVVLLISGTVIGLISLKRVKNKELAFTGLIILAINLILFLVPKR